MTSRGDEARHGGSPNLRGRPSDRAGGAEAAGPIGPKPWDIFTPDLHIDGIGAPNVNEATPAIRVRTLDFR